MLFFIMQLNDEDYDKFLRLYEESHKPLLNYAYSILHDKQLAEEATQDAFIRIMRNLDKLSENERSKTFHYMVRVVKHVAFSTYKKEKPAANQDLFERDLDDFEDENEVVWSAYQAKELYQEIRHYVINNMDEIDRTILTLRSSRGMSYRGIAEIVGLSESNVSVRLTRLRKKMKSELFGKEKIL